MIYSYLFSFLFFTSSLLSSASPSDSIKVNVIDEKENPVAGVKVLIDNNKASITNQSGTYKFKPARKLVMPFQVAADIKGYEIDGFSYYEEDHEIEVRLKKVELISNGFALHFISQVKKPLKNVNLVYAGKNYTADNNGLIKLSEKKFVQAMLSVNGFEIGKIDVTENPKTYTIQLSPSLSKELPKDIISVPVSKDKDTSGKIVVNNNQVLTTEQEKETFKQYQGEFENLSTDILQERERLIASSNKIRAQITAITNRLKNEKNLTQDQRNELKKYLDKLENELIENAIAYNKEEEKTRGLITKLRYLLLQKDSINYITQQKLKVEEKKRIQAEKKNKRTLIVFSIITVSLLFLAIVFYAIARKMRSQRTILLKNNNELTNSKSQLEENIHRINLQKELIEEQNKQLDIFAYKASHDIKGPLNSISGLCNVASSSSSADSDSKAIFSQIHKTSQKLSDLITDMLLIAKDAKREVVKTQINISEMINEIVTSFKNFEGFEKITINNKVKDTVELNSDPVLLHSVIQNFIENAIKYADHSKDKSLFNITAEADDKKVTLTFEDNGMGILEEHISKIFDMFYKINPKSQGSGLGLYIVKSNVEKLGGKINIVTEKGKGSTFTVEFTKG